MNKIKKFLLMIWAITIVTLVSCGDDSPVIDDNDIDKDPPIEYPDAKHFGEVEFTKYEDLPEGSFGEVNKYFSPLNPPNTLLAHWLNKNFIEGGPGSTITVIYDFLDFEFPESRNKLSQTYTQLTEKDYEEKWGLNNPNTYTPSTNIHEEIKKVLKKNYSPIDNSNPFRVVQYKYSSEEPVLEDDVELYAENFEDVANPSNYRDNYWNKWLDESHKPEGILKVVDGTADIFQPYTRGTVKGLFTRLNNKNGDSWFITPEIDLKNEPDPILFFRLGIGFFRGFENFELMISTDFDGNPDNILDATWNEHTDDLIITSGGTYADIITESSWVTESSMNSLQLDLSEYTNFDKVYIGFRDHPGPNPTSSALPFIVIDQIKVEGIKSVNVSESSIEPKMALYKKTDENWEEQTDNYYFLTKDDYESTGLEFLSETQAIEKLPAILESKIDNAKEKDVYTIIYKRSETEVVGDVYRLINGEWQISNNPETEKRKLPYKFTETSWVLDK